MLSRHRMIRLSRTKVTSRFERPNPMNLISEKCFVDRTLTQRERQIVSATIARLGSAAMTKTAHGYCKDANETVREAAERGTRDYTKNSRSSSAIAIMDVILAANRDYNKQVKGKIEHIRQRHPLLTIKRLAKMVEEAGTAKEFQSTWGHNDAGKFQVLKDVLAVFMPRLGKNDSPDHDFAILAAWAERAELMSMHDDAVGRIHNVGIATFQHLRMTFGVNTVKPDRRVKEVLQREFGLHLTDKKSILVVERMAEVEGIPPLLLDQIFVKYGSGHYVANADAVRSAVEAIVRNLKKMRLPDTQIAQATGWTLREIESL